MPSGVKHPRDLREFEHKFLLRTRGEEGDVVVRTLGGDPSNFSSLDADTLESKLKKKYGDPKLATKVDNYYIPELKDPSSFFERCEFTVNSAKTATLQVSEYSINLRRYAKQDMSEAYQGLQELMRESATTWNRYNQLQDEQRTRGDARNMHSIDACSSRLKEIKIRIRTETSGGEVKYILTAKDKAKSHKGGMEENPEYEMRFETEDDMKKYITAMNLVFNATKTKHTKTYSNNGINLELVTVDQIPGAEFLEIETQAPKEQRQQAQDQINERARWLKIPRPTKNIYQGGRAVDVGYLTLMERL